jgi:hypothetical protein
VAFKHIKFAKDLVKKQSNYELTQDKKAFINIIRVFDSSFFDKHYYMGGTQARPVFIFGMLRFNFTLAN